MKTIKYKLGFVALELIGVVGLVVALAVTVGAFNNFQNPTTKANEEVKTAVFNVVSNSDIANEDGSYFELPGSWIGNGQSLDSSFLGLRLKGDVIPKGAVIRSAKLNFVPDKESWISIAFEVRTEDKEVAESFSDASKPSSRTTLETSSSYADNVKWEANETYSYDITPVMQAFVDKYQSDTISLIIKGVGGKWGRKYPFGKEKPRVEVQYAIQGELAVSQPTQKATLTPRSKKTPKPTSTIMATPTVSPSPSIVPTSVPVPTSPPPIGTGGQILLTDSGGYGVGRGDGLEVGIRMDVFNQLKQNAANGMYDRKCTEAEHDKNKWHSLVNPVANCHYDHFHGDDPSYVDDIFGAPGAWFGQPNRSISTPWQTFPATSANESNAQYIASGKMENDIKHHGYVWVVRRDQPCNQDFCVTDFRVLLHNLEMHSFGAATRFHSVSAEVRVCRRASDPSSCGIIRTGGWFDHGNLILPPLNLDCWESRQSRPEFLVKLPSDNQYYPFFDPDLVDEFRCHKPLGSADISRGSARSGSVAPAEWWAHGASDFRYQFLVFDPIGNVVETSLGSGQLRFNAYCARGQVGCPWNQSLFSVRLQYIVPVNSYFVSGFTNGTRVNLPLGRRYITRFGDINNNCSSAGLDCIPIEYSNLTVNVEPGRGLAGFNHESCNNCTKVDHDITPSGRPSWVTWYFDEYGL